MRLLLLAVLGSIVASPTLAAEKPAPAPVKPVAPSTLRVINNSETDSAQVQANVEQGAGPTAGPDCKTIAARTAPGVGCTPSAAEEPKRKPTNGTGGQGGGRITAPPVKPTGGN